MRFRFKKRLKYNKKQSFSIIFLCLLVIGVTLGFALLTTKLKVSGTSQVSASTWDVHFENIQAKSGSVTATTAPVISNDTEINFSAELPEAGKFYAFTVDVVNDGTYDAKLDEIVITPTLTTEQQEYFSYTVTYSDGTSIKKNDALASGSTETLLVHFRYKVNSDRNKYPTEDVDFNCSVSMYYVQGEGNEVIHLPYKYSISSTEFNIGSAIPAGETVYDNYIDAITASQHDFFTRHLISGGLITESYVGFVKDSNVYYLRGAGATFDDDTDDLITPSPYYESNKATLLSAFGSSNCTDYTNSYECSAGGLYANAIMSGLVDAGVDSWSCHVYGGGSSGCDDGNVG